MKATVKKTKHACSFGLYHALLYLLATAVAILLCVCAERAEERYYLKWDVSATRVSSLSDYTLAQLENLAQPVTIYPVYTAGSTLSLKDLQTETLLRMRLASCLVEVETIDPVAQPQRLQELAGDTADVAEGTVFVRDAAGTRVIRLNAEDFLFSQRIEEDVYTIYCGEAMLIGAIERACAPEVPAAWFITGHGEATREECSRLTLQMQAMGLEVHSGALGMIEAQPGDVALLMDPQRDLTESEALAMADFLDSGGHLLLACGADTPWAELPQLQALCQVYGLGFQAGWVVEDATVTDAYVERPEWLSPSLSGDNGLVDTLPGRLILPRACALAVPGIRPGITAHVLLTTSERAVLHTHTTGDALAAAPGDTSGQMLLAVLFWLEKGSILQLASADMLRDQAETSGASVVDASENLALVACWLDEMTGQKGGATLDAGVKELPNQLIRFDSEQTRQRVSALFLTALPVALLALMLVVLLRRRRL